MEQKKFIASEERLGIHTDAEVDEDKRNAKRSWCRRRRCAGRVCSAARQIYLRPLPLSPSLGI